MERYDFSKPSVRRARPSTKLAWSPRASSGLTEESPPSRISPRVMNWRSAVRRLAVVSCAVAASGRVSSAAMRYRVFFMGALFVHL